MTDGLITRIGKWIDFKWAPKATWLDVQEQECKCSERHIGALELVTDLKIEHSGRIEQLKTETKTALMSMRSELASQAEFVSALQKEKVPPEIAKDLADLKTRVEKIELYSGMKRTVDPTKPPVLKSAFQI